MAIEKENGLSVPLRRSLASEGIQGIQSIITKDTSQKEAYLIAVQQLLVEAHNALSLHDLASDTDLLPDEAPPTDKVRYVEEITSDGPDITVTINGNRHLVDVKAHDGERRDDRVRQTITPRTATTWEEIREVMYPVLLRSTWGYALVKFNAAMLRPPRPGRRSNRKKQRSAEDVFRAEHTAEWLAKNPSLKDDFFHYLNIRDNHESHARRGLAAERITYVPEPPDNRRVLFTDWKLKGNASVNYDPKAEDNDRLSNLVMSAWGFTCASLPPEKHEP